MKNVYSSQSATIAAITAEIYSALNPIAKRYNVAPKIEFRGPQRAIRGSAPFRPDKHCIVIEFEPSEQSPKSPVTTSPTGNESAPYSLGGALQVLVRSLDRAEYAPGHTFVAIKWFRDQALAREGMSRLEADAALTQAIDEGLALTAKINNPKNPTFQTTTIRLNRSDPRVAKLLAGAGPALRRFEPIDLGGASLSEVILRERR